MERMAVIQMMMISASITAYSTAVGPSSETRKRCTLLMRHFISSSASRGGSLRASPDLLLGAVKASRARDFSISEKARQHIPLHPKPISISREVKPRIGAGQYDFFLDEA